MPSYPAAAATRSSADLDAVLLTHVHSVLSSAGITHGALTPGPAALNLTLSDGANVFVKVSRPGAWDTPTRRRGLENEVSNSRWAMQAGFGTPEPLLPRLSLVRDLRGRRRAVSVWRHHALEPISEPTAFAHHTVQTALALADHPPRWRRGPFTAPTEALGRILGLLSGFTTATARVLADIAVAECAHISAALRERPQVRAHLDLHPGNLAYRAGTTSLVVLDWADLNAAPIEWDLAQACHSVLTHPAILGTAQQRHRAQADLVTAAVAGFAERGYAVDLDLLAACARFRSASAAAFQLASGADPAWLAGNCWFLDVPR